MGDSMPEFQHQPVLLQTAIAYLNVKPAGVYVDATLGGAGHSLKIAESLNENGLIIGIDQDQAAIEAARNRLQNVKPRVELVHRNFLYLKEIVAGFNQPFIDGILFDLGVSSPQLDLEERGFSYKQDAPLDMRMDQAQPFSAHHLVNSAPVDELARILREYGEERFSQRIAHFIDKYRRDHEINTTGELADIIKQAIPAATRRSGPHPARRSFQALRIAVNHELEYLQDALNQAIDLLGPEGRMVVISYHSLEDRLVKTTMAEWAKGCQCPRSFPVCICNRKPKLKILSAKPRVSGEEELTDNPRARSAKLRAAEKLS
jgi:16S rRNA (cytosine1402-N4)-methyltransferase